MYVAKKITIDLNRPRKEVVHLGQGDNTHQISLTLLSDGLPYDVTADAGGATINKFVKYIKANGVDGSYDTTSTGVTAVVAGSASNKWTVTLDEHATDYPGFAEVFVVFATGSGKILHSFPVTVDVVKTSSGNTDPGQPYYNNAAFVMVANQATKTSAMTQRVGIDAVGRLWVPPGGGTDSYMYVEGTTLFMGDNMSGTISITENGTYNVKPYASATVNVPAGITPTGTIAITANGTVDVTNYAQASVNVPSSGGNQDVTQTFSDWTNTGISSANGATSYNANRILCPRYFYKYKAVSIPTGYDYAIWAVSLPAMDASYLVPKSTYFGSWTGTEWAKSLNWHSGGTTVDLTQLENWDKYAFYVLLRNAGSDSSISTTVGENVEFVYNLNDHPLVCEVSV